MSCTRRRRRLAAAALVLSAGCAGCALTVRENRQLQGWLACTECDAGQLDSVVRLGRRLVKRRAVLDSLTRAALGPSNVAGITQELSQAYARDSAYVLGASGHLPAGWPSRAEWVGRHAENRVAVVQARALRAVALIDSTGSRVGVLLDSLATRALRPDVRTAVDRLRAVRARAVPP